MKLRQPALPPGWYPRRREILEDQIRGFLDAAGGIAAGEARACVVPHAGWAFSGNLAALTMGFLDREIKALAVLGGHLSPGTPLRYGGGDGFQAPNGVIPGHPGLLSFILEEIPGIEDLPGDNTIEVLLPLVRYFFPDRPVVEIRVPPDSSALALGRRLRAWEELTGETLGVVASTDLTHYGPNYGWTPLLGQPPAAVRLWAKEENDLPFLRALAEGREGEAITQALGRRSACSPGPAAAAVSFARASGRLPGRITGYSSSADIHPSDSFVGYGGVIF
ncbi:MAG: AmmeMemoRadiSam system protein B [Spirochaetales bacterium]|nr:AmmeMemoRadiSam system protein B [Spirochaetales bacterium]